MPGICLRRGLYTYDEIIKEDLKVKPSGEVKSGRNKAIIAERNFCLLHRYYYYARIANLRYDLVIKQLTKEFFLTPETIPRIINREIVQFREIASKKLTLRQLERKFPHYSWHYIPRPAKKEKTTQPLLRRAAGAG